MKPTHLDHIENIEIRAKQKTQNADESEKMK